MGRVAVHRPPPQIRAPPAVAAPAAAAAPLYARNTPAQCRTILDEMNGVLAPGAFFDGAVAPFGFPARPCQLLAMDPGCERALKHCLALGRLQAETSEGGVVECVDDDMVLRQAYSLLCQTERPYLTEVFRQIHGLHVESDAHYEGICSLYTLAPVGLFTGFVWECLALVPRPMARLLKNQAWHDYHERYYGKAAVRASVAAHGAATSQYAAIREARAHVASEDGRGNADVIGSAAVVPDGVRAVGDGGDALPQDRGELLSLESDLQERTSAADEALRDLNEQRRRVEEEYLRLRDSTERKMQEKRDMGGELARVRERLKRLRVPG